MEKEGDRGAFTYRDLIGVFIASQVVTAVIVWLTILIVRGQV